MYAKHVLLSALCVVAAAAMPADMTLETRQVVQPNDYCPDGLLYTSFQCCVTRVLGSVVDLDCDVPSDVPDECDTPESICESQPGGGVPQCCTLPALGLGVLCQDVGI